MGELLYITKRLLWYLKVEESGNLRKGFYVHQG